MRHLNRVAANSDVNKMEPSNLAIVFGYKGCILKLICSPTAIRTKSNGNDDMSAAYANMLNMSYQNGLIEAIILQTEVNSLKYFVYFYSGYLMVHSAKCISFKKNKFTFI
jgi:hypothetical protein